MRFILCIRNAELSLLSQISQLFFPEIILLKSTVKFHNNLDLKSEIFTNKYVCYGMIISPCSMGFLAGIANGDSKILLKNRQIMLFIFKAADNRTKRNSAK